MTDRQLSPDAQLQYDELIYGFRSRLADGDADDAVDTLDALLDAYRDQVLAAARARVEQLPTANDGQLIAAYRDVVLNTIVRTGQEG